MYKNQCNNKPFSVFQNLKKTHFLFLVLIECKNVCGDGNPQEENSFHLLLRPN